MGCSCSMALGDCTRKMTYEGAVGARVLKPEYQNDSHTFSRVFIGAVKNFPFTSSSQGSTNIMEHSESKIDEKIEEFLHRLNSLDFSFSAYKLTNLEDRPGLSFEQAIDAIKKYKGFLLFIVCQSGQSSFSFQVCWLCLAYSHPGYRIVFRANRHFIRSLPAPLPILW